MDIIVARHGLSEANIAEITSGISDSKLTEQGRQQAQSLADRVKDLDIQRIYCSSLSRAKDTAEPIAKLTGLKPVIDDRLIEVNMGSFEGKPSQLVKDTVGKSPTELLNDYKYDFSPYGGETSEQVKARIKDFLDYLKTQDLELVLIITHGGVMRWINYICTGEKIGPQPNAEELSLQY